jgi:hypothetical protein
MCCWLRCCVGAGVGLVDRPICGTGISIIEVSGPPLLKMVERSEASFSKTLGPNDNGLTRFGDEGAYERQLHGVKFNFRKVAVLGRTNPIH